MIAWNDDGRHRSIMLGLLVLCYTFSLLDRHIMALLMIPIQKDLALTDVQLGLINGLAFAALFSIASLPIGMMVDRGSRRRVIFVGMAVWSIAASACGLARGFWSLAAARVGVGLGEASLTPAAYSILSDVYPPRKLASALGIYAMGGSIGVVLAFALGGLVVEWLSDVHLVLPVVGALKPWQATFIITGLPGLFIASLILLVPEPPRRGVARDVRLEKGLRPLLSYLAANRRIVLIHMIGFCLACVSVYAIFTWSAVYLGRHFGMPTAQIGLSLAVVLGGGGIVSKLAWGYVIDAMLARGYADAHYRATAIGMLAGAAFGIAAFLAGDVATCLILLTLCAMSLEVFLPAGSSALQIMTPNDLRGQMSVIYLFMLNTVALGLGSILVAVLTDYVFHDKAMIGMSLAIVIGLSAPLAALILFVGRRAYVEKAAIRLAA